MINKLNWRIEAIGISAYLLIVFSGFYLNVLSISPIYVSTACACVLLLFGWIKCRFRLEGDRSILWAMVFIVYLLLTHIDVRKDSAFYNTLFSLLYYIVSFPVICLLSKEETVTYARKFINFTIVLCIIEASWRISHPIVRNLGQNFFYNYKYNSIMYHDSNFVGIYLISVFFLIIYLQNKAGIVLKKQKILTLVLIILTFSRSAILVSIAFGFLLDNSISKSFKTFAIMFGIYFAISVLTNLIMNDGSFLSKLEIINRAIRYYHNASSVQRLFGVGLGHTIDYLHIGAHNFIVTYIIETGIVGFCILVIMWINIFFSSKKQVYYVMIPFLFAGFSMAQHFLPYLYCIYNIITHLERDFD